MKKIILLMAMAMVPVASFAQNPAAEAETQTVTVAEQEHTPLILPPLFEYPVAPDDMPWRERSNWLVEHFWDNFDFKQKSVGQSQLLHAFRTFVVPMHLADKDVAVKSVDALIKKIQKNPGLLLQFTQAAERTIYDPQSAGLMIDEVYVRFLNAIAKNKKIPELRRVRYESQYASLKDCLQGATMPSFTFTEKSGPKMTYTNTGVPTIIEFGDFDCTECRISRLRMETDGELQELVSQGKARILFISPDVDPSEFETWSKAVKGYPETWTVGVGEGLEDVLDLRTIPCIYLIDASGNIVTKGATSDRAREFVKAEAAR